MTGQDPYDWTKNRITDLVQKIRLVKNDGDMVSPGQIWSIKKLLALDYYIDAAHIIFRKNFTKWCFVDTHCGSGLIGFEDKLLKDEKFPGSPLIAALRNSKQPFSEYHMSDISEEAIEALKCRLSTLKDNVGNQQYNPQVRTFSDTAELIPKMDTWGTIFLIFIDPKGYSDLHWKYVEKLLSVDKADIFITLMSYGMALSRPRAMEQDSSEAKTFDSIFGTCEWRNCNTQDDLVELYLGRLRTKKKYVEEIPIFRAGENKLYSLIFASNNSSGAGKIMTYTKGIMDKVTTELIEDALKVATKKKSDLDSWLIKNK